MRAQLCAWMHARTLNMHTRYNDKHMHTHAVMLNCTQLKTGNDPEARLAIDDCW
jgi:hypothetical protein